MRGGEDAEGEAWSAGGTPVENADFPVGHREGEEFCREPFASSCPPYFRKSCKSFMYWEY